MSSNEFDDLNESMLRRFYSINPDQATTFGMHDPYDGQLPNGGVKQLEDTLTLMKEWESRASKVAKSGGLSEDQRTSLDVLRMCVELQDFAINDFQEWRMFPEACEMPGAVLFNMISREYAPYEQRAAWMSSRIEQLPRYLAEFRTRFEKGARPVKAWTEHAIKTCEGLPGFLDFIVEHSKGKVSPESLEELQRNVAASKLALAEHLEWLRVLLKESTTDMAMGRKKLERLLELRGFSMTSDDMLALAIKGLEELKSLRAEAARRISPSDPSKALRIIRDDAPANFDLTLEETRKEMQKAKNWMVEQGVCTLDYEGDVLVMETPQFMRSGVTSAALFMPAVFDRQPHGIYLMTRPDNLEDMKQLFNRAGIVNTTVHEAYPGHYHQGAMSFKKPWMHQLHLMMLTTDVMVCGYETMEGWAHYCEKMMFERGYEADDKAYYTMLDFAIWRACRVVYDISLCRGEATIEQMVEFFMRETDSSKETAEAEIIGFSRTPSYALSYFTGRHLVMQLKEELKKELGQGFDEKKFHDLMAINGNLPFHLAMGAVRKGMGSAIPPRKPL